MTVVPNFRAATRWAARAGVPDETSAGARFMTERISGDMMRVGVQGEIDLLNAPALRRYASARLRPSARMVLDLSEVEFIGSAGLSVFEGLDARAHQCDARWVLVGNRPVQRLLLAAGETRLQLHTSLESAMGALRRSA
ncbi:STAS domain-containing protein [Rhodococcus zopfii]|uniref:STAS domain-containing protein n=1 Tax=Rhodococcus zopfii TaxID=43772 RepID=UPI00111118FA|nr:STAS domain-containing protein [Rhodococcus zopfii]